MPYQRILAAVDTNENCSAIMERALEFSGNQPKHIDCVTVVPIVVSSIPYANDFQESMVQSAKKDMQELSAQYPGIKAVSSLGRPHHEITDYAKKHDRDLIVMGSHGKHGLDLILGSTANGVVHHAKTDVLTVRIDDKGNKLNTKPYAKLLLATDFHDEDLVKKGVQLAEKLGAELHLIHVVANAKAMNALFLPTLDEEILKQAEQRADAFCKTNKFPTERLHIKQGLPADGVLECAEQVGAELIVMGSHGRGLLDSLLVGSTANAVLHHAKQDILIINLRD